jgi:hypothetical protein
MHARLEVDYDISKKFPNQFSQAASSAGRLSDAFWFLLFWVVPRETDAQETICFANRVTQPLFAPVTDYRTGQRVEGAAPELLARHREASL